MWNGRTGPEVGVCLRCPKFTRKFENMFRGADRSRDMGGGGIIRVQGQRVIDFSLQS